MTGFILAITISFSVLHTATGVEVESVTAETFQAPLKTLDECNRWAALREANARRNLAMLGITDAQIDHACLPAGEEL